MSLKPQEDLGVPDETRRVAMAAFPKGCACLRIGDVLGCVYQDRQFEALFPRRGQPAEAPGRLALATVLQFTEGFSDRQAADAVRARIDWKYALGLELTDAGFDHTVLSEFRTRLVEGKLELVLLDVLLERVQALGLLKRRGKQRTDSTHVLAAIRTMNRLERVGETLRAALNSLAVTAPEWLRAVAAPEWFKLYGRRIENFNLPKTEAERTQLAAVIGSDGKRLLQAIAISDARESLGKLDAVILLERVWEEQFVEENGRLRFREVKEMPSPSTLITSPYDHEARYSTKRGESWVGYKVHLTESCDDDLPRLITNIETTPATTPDDNLIEVVHRSLDGRNLLPSEHLVDKGYTDATVLVASQRDYGVEVIGPVVQDPSWQSRDKAGFDKTNVQPASKVSPGYQKPIRHRAWTSKRAFLDETARPVPLAPNAQDRSRSHVSSASRPAIFMKRSRRCKRDKQRRISGSPTHLGPASKAPTPRRSAAVECAAHAIGVLSKHACNMSSRRLQSTSCETHPGQTERRLPRRAAPTSRRSNSVPREFATSVNVGFRPNWPTQ
jgi:transposase